MQSGETKPKGQKSSDRHGVHCLGMQTESASSSSESASVSAPTGVSRNPPTDGRDPRLSESLEELLPHFRAMTAFLSTDGKPQDDRILRFVELLISNGVTRNRVNTSNLEARFYDFLDADIHSNIHAMYLQDDTETRLIGQLTLRDLSKILEETPERRASNIGQ
jgi:hypothetical protein